MSVAVDATVFFILRAHYHMIKNDYESTVIQIICISYQGEMSVKDDKY